MRVPLLDLKAQYSVVREGVLGAIIDVLDSQVFIGGSKVADIEREIATLCGCRYGVGASSGTDAILNTLISLGIGVGDEVITTPFTFFATAGSIARTGARPVFVDIDANTLNISPELIESAITNRTRAILPVHLFGQMADMDPIMAIAARHGITVVEDAAQALGAEYKGRRAGSIGLAGCLSFFPSKNLGGAGDGGMIVTNDSNLYERLLIMRNHGAKPKYFHKYIGGNFRLDALQAAVLLAKLPHLDAWCNARRSNAVYYDQRFAGTPVRTPFVRACCASTFNQYVIRVQRRDDLQAYLEAQGVGCEVYYPLPLHLQECFASLGYIRCSFPQAEMAAGEALALPVYPELTDTQKDHVVEAVLSFFGISPTCATGFSPELETPQK